MSEIPSIIQKDIRRPGQSTSELGTRGESLAADYLVKTGYRLVVSNFKVPVGRNSRGVQITGEIDIIALDGDTLAFIEVKTRRSDEIPVIASVDLRKQRQIIRTARVYRRLFNVYDMTHRFDVVTVVTPKHAEPKIVLIKSFWTESKFKKQTWKAESWYDHA